jgi:hypothetical protein
VADGRAEAGPVLLPVLLRPLNKKFGVWRICHAVRSVASSSHQCFWKKRVTLLHC